MLRRVGNLLLGPCAHSSTDRCATVAWQWGAAQQHRQMCDSGLAVGDCTAAQTDVPQWLGSGVLHSSTDRCATVAWQWGTAQQHRQMCHKGLAVGSCTAAQTDVPQRLGLLHPKCPRQRHIVSAKHGRTYPEVKGVPEIELPPHGLQDLFADAAALRLRALQQHIVPHLHWQQLNFYMTSEWLTIIV